MTIKQFINYYGPTCEGADWLCKQRSLKRAWEICPRSDWMLWVLGRIGYNDDWIFWLYACWCVRYTKLADGRTIWDLLTDERSRWAVDVAEAFAEGQTTQEELIAAKAAAWDAAWDAAKAAAKDAARVATWDAVRAAAWVARATAWVAAWVTAWISAGAAARDAVGVPRATAWAAALLQQAEHLREVIPWIAISSAIRGRGER